MSVTTILLHASPAWSWAKAAVRPAIENGTLFVGLGLICWGAYLIYRPLAPIFCGLCLVGVSILISSDRSTK